MDAIDAVQLPCGQLQDPTAMLKPGDITARAMAAWVPASQDRLRVLNAAYSMVGLGDEVDKPDMADEAFTHNLWWSKEYPIDGVLTVYVNDFTRHLDPTKVGLKFTGIERSLSQKADVITLAAAAAAYPEATVTLIETSPVMASYALNTAPKTVPLAAAVTAARPKAMQLLARCKDNLRDKGAGPKSYNWYPLDTDAKRVLRVSHDYTLSDYLYAHFPEHFTGTTADQGYAAPDSPHFTWPYGGSPVSPCDSPCMSIGSNF
jgi:hypothetical protein